MTVYDFYSLLKSAHAGQQFACGTKKDSKSYRPDMYIIIVLALASHASLNHTLSFSSCYSDFDVVLFGKSRVYIRLGTAGADLGGGGGFGG